MNEWAKTIDFLIKPITLKSNSKKFKLFEFFRLWQINHGVIFKHHNHDNNMIINII
jgi:hypothetical protein